MNRRWGTSSDKGALRRRYSSGVLKVCPVCGTLNVEDVQECFVCWWHGEFDADPLHVQVRLAELVSRCPELIGLLEQPPRPLGRIVLWLRRLWMRAKARIDVSV